MLGFVVSTVYSSGQPTVVEARMSPNIIIVIIIIIIIGVSLLVNLALFLVTIAVILDIRDVEVFVAEMLPLLTHGVRMEDHTSTVGR